MKRRDLFKLATGSVAAFLVGKYGVPKPTPQPGEWYYIPSEITERRKYTALVRLVDIETRVFMPK